MVARIEMKLQELIDGGAEHRSSSPEQDTPPHSLLQKRKKESLEQDTHPVEKEERDER